MSSPGAMDISEPPMTTAKQASPAPTANASAKTVWTLTPMADNIGWSSTPALIMIPIQVLLTNNQRPTPTISEIAMMNSLYIGNFPTIGSVTTPYNQSGGTS